MPEGRWRTDRAKPADAITVAAHMRPEAAMHRDVVHLRVTAIAGVVARHVGDRGDEQMNGIPMHRGLGPHVRGDSDRIRGLGTIGAQATFGHGGAGTSYSWADPESGVSFSYLTNYMAPDPWHSARLDRVANLVHAAID